MTKLIGFGCVAVFVATMGYAAIPRDVQKDAPPAVNRPAAPEPLRIAPYTKTNTKRA